MCFICDRLADESLSMYDADILAVELASFIGHGHALELKQQIKQVMKKLEEIKEENKKSLEYVNDFTLNYNPYDYGAD